jgi:tripartite-type tricarboxylate transporter receptor subunit TctC
VLFEVSLQGKSIMKRVLATLLLCASASAWAWQPTKPVTVLIGFGPGSGNEMAFRAVAEDVERRTGANFVVVTRPGADSVISLNELVRSQPDGYTINIASQQNTWVMADVLQRSVKEFDSDSFTYTVNIAKSPLAIIAPVDSAVNTPQQLVDLLKTTTKPVTFAVGSSSHKLAYEYLVNRVRPAPGLVAAASYKGPSQAGADVAGKHVDFGIIPAAVAYTLVKAGKVKYIALCGEQRLQKIPDVPLMDTVVPGLHVYAGWGILLPKNTAPEIAQWYTDNFRESIKGERAQRFFQDNLMFVEQRELTPEGYRKSMQDLRQIWLPIAQKMTFESNK